MKSRCYRQEITKESEILLFGKFKHKTIQHVLRTEPSYILWLDEEKIVNFSREILTKAEELVDDERMDEGNDPSRLQWYDVVDPEW